MEPLTLSQEGRSSLGVDYHSSSVLVKQQLSTVLFVHQCKNMVILPGNE